MNIVFDLFEVWSPQKSGLISSVCAVCVYIYICVCVYMKYKYTFTYNQICVYTFACICICMYMYIYIQYVVRVPGSVRIRGLLIPIQYIYIYYSNYYIDCIGDKCICICKWI